MQWTGVHIPVFQHSTVSRVFNIKHVKVSLSPVLQLYTECLEGIKQERTHPRFPERNLA